MSYDLRDRTIRLSDGAETTLAQWGAGGPIVVGVHGIGSSRRGWGRIGEHLADRFRVIAYDQRGHGDAGTKSPMTLRRSVEDLVDVVRSLGEPVHALIGHSWGGAVVVAGGRELAVSRVAAIDPMLYVEPGVWSKGALAEYQHLFTQTLEEREAAVRSSFSSLPAVEIEAKLHATRRMTLAPIVAIGEENAIDQGHWDLREVVVEYPKPLLLAVADPKRSVVPEDQRAFFRQRGGANVQIEVFAGANHSLQRTAFERFIPVLEAFLSAV
jgi:pimeloyl-ACP methyl ester carboxylesterase